MIKTYRKYRTIISIIFIILFLFLVIPYFFENDQPKEFTTVICLYFPLNKSKHSIDDYSNWVKNALLSIKSPIVMFTDPKTKYSFSQIRKDKIIYFLYENVWELMKELEVSRKISYINEYQNNQHSKDPEKSIHNPNLYAIWNLKAYICEKIAIQNPFKSAFFIYSDIGSWRNGLIENWPDNNFITILVNHLKDRMLFGQIANVENNDQFNIYHDSIEGTFFAGSKKALTEYADLFYKIHDKRFSENLFIGKDQTIMNLIVFKTNPNPNKVLLPTWKLHDCNFDSDKKIYNTWFFYQQYLSSEKTYNCSYDKRISILKNY